VKLTLLLCEQAKHDSPGTIAGLGIGVTKLTVHGALPGRFSGSLLFIATPHAAEMMGGDFPVQVSIKAPTSDWMKIGDGNMTMPQTHIQSAGVLPVALTLPVEGDYTLRIEVGGSTGEVGLQVDVKELAK
jgi:hypothetical protein